MSALRREHKSSSGPRRGPASTPAGESPAGPGAELARAQATRAVLSDLLAPRIRLQPEEWWEIAFPPTTPAVRVWRAWRVECYNALGRWASQPLTVYLSPVEIEQVFRAQGLRPDHPAPGAD